MRTHPQTQSDTPAQQGRLRLRHGREGHPDGPGLFRNLVRTLQGHRSSSRKVRASLTLPSTRPQTLVSNN